MKSTHTPLSSRPRLPAERAFVIHLLDDADPERGTYPGRVEHVTSGDSRRFDGVPALLEFFREKLAPLVGRDRKGTGKEQT